MSGAQDLTSVSKTGGTSSSAQVTVTSKVSSKSSVDDKDTERGEGQSTSGDSSRVQIQYLGSSFLGSSSVEELEGAGALTATLNQTTEAAREVESGDQEAAEKVTVVIGATQKDSPPTAETLEAAGSTSTVVLGVNKEDTPPVHSMAAQPADEPPTFDEKKKDQEYADFLKNLKDKKSKRILVIGEQGVGKSSFINSAITAITGKYETHAAAGLKGEGVSNVTVHLRSYTPEDYGGDISGDNTDTKKALPVFIDVMGFDDNLSNRLIQQTLGDTNTTEASGDDNSSDQRYGELVESVNSILMEYILRGRIPDRCNLLDFGREIINGQLEDLNQLEILQEKEELKIDAVVMIVPRGCKNLPKKLLKTIKQETQRRDIDVPVFGVMSKMDKKDGDSGQTWRELEFDFRGNLGIDGNYFVPLSNYVYDTLVYEKPDPNPNTDVPILKMLNQIYRTKAEKIILIGEKLRQKKAKELKEKQEKEKKFGTVFFVLIALVVLLLVVVVGYVFYTKFTRQTMSTSFSDFTTSDTTPVPPTPAPKKEL